MMACNYFGGCHPIKEDSEGFKKSRFVEADSWHDLYKKHKYCCLETGALYFSMWISPDGTTFMADCFHEAAESIVDVIFGFGESEKHPEDFIKHRGWIKITTDIILYYYANEGLYKTVTKAQLSVLRKWCNCYNRDLSKLEIKDII